jgi:F0F1-type ATP synthase assembly protein I
MAVLVGGLAAVIVGAVFLGKCLGSFWIVLKGTIPAVLILGGLASIGVGISSIKDKIAAKKEEDDETKKEKK